LYDAYGHPVAVVGLLANVTPPYPLDEDGNSHLLVEEDDDRFGVV